MFQKSAPVRVARLLGIGIALLAAVLPAHAAGKAAAGKAKAGACAGCHGADGNGGSDPSWPKLAGQHEGYLVAQLQAFKSGARKDPMMSGMAAGLSKKDMEDIAAYFASLEIRPGAARSKDAVDKGERMYRGGNAKTGVSACMSCHGPSGHGIPPRFPKVSGQSANYTEKQLLAFRADKRKSESDIMTRIAQRMTEAEIRDVSDYMAGLH